MKTYSFQIGQLEDEHLTWLVDQAKEKLPTSPEFFAALGNACYGEKQRRLLNPDDEPTELSVPWIVEHEGHYQAACQFAVFGMQSAHEQQYWILRNFFDVMVQILYNQVDQAIYEHVQAGTVSTIAH